MEMSSVTLALGEAGVEVRGSRPQPDYIASSRPAWAT